VEKGKAPESMVASKIVNGQVVRTRPLCPYPQVARYKGKGNIDEAQNFSCVVPEAGDFELEGAPPTRSVSELVLGSAIPRSEIHLTTSVRFSEARRCS
jgi:hypothetical protein